MRHKIKVHPLSAPGKYYVDQNTCLCSDSCSYYAPDHFKVVLASDYGYYVAKQPETPEEEALCQKAMDSCPVEAIYNDGEIESKTEDFESAQRKGELTNE